MLAPRLVHLIAGSTGAGKTTYAMALADRIGGVRFSIDEWMTTLFWMDSATPIDPAWAMERVRRCYSQIWATAEQTAKHGLPVVLDLGFSRAADRSQIAGRARAAALAPQLHFLDVSAEERWRRVQARNTEKGETHRLDVTRAMFDFVETLWEAPAAEEIAGLDGIRV